MRFTEQVNVDEPTPELCSGPCQKSHSRKKLSVFDFFDFFDFTKLWNIAWTLWRDSSLVLLTDRGTSLKTSQKCLSPVAHLGLSVFLQPLLRRGSFMPLTFIALPSFFSFFSHFFSSSFSSLSLVSSVLVLAGFSFLFPLFWVFFSYR